MKYAEKRRTEKGFSLIEVMLAISILAVGFLAVGSMQIASIHGNSTARGISEGATWAGYEIERLITLRWNHSDLTDTDDDGNSGLDDDTEAEADHQVDQGRYTIYWNVANGQAIADTKTINLIVTWMEGATPRRVIMQRIIPKIT